MIFSKRLNEEVLRWANRMISSPVCLDFAYGRVGRMASYVLRNIEMACTRLRRVSIRHFKGSYFYPAKTLQLVVTNVCNARCTFCAYRIVADAGRPTGVMKMETFKKAIDELSRLGGKTIDLTPTVGDPLLDPALIEKIKYCREQTGINSITLTTNAIAINKRDMYKQLVDAGTTMIAISLPGLDAETYKTVYGIDRYPDVIKGIAALLRYNQERGEPSRIVLRFRNPDKPSVLVRSKDFIDYIRPYLSDKVTCNFTIDYDNWGGSINEQDMHGVMKLRAIPPRINVPCSNLFNFTIRYDGSVRLCGCRLKDTEDDGLVVGNIRDSTLEELGRSQKVHDIIEGFYHGVRPSTCEQCSFYRPLSHKIVKSFEQVA